MNILKVSPKGQVTIPRHVRNLIKTDRLLFEMKGKVITLKPMKLEVDEAISNFSDLASKSFEFWDNKQDDVYQTFYE
ncbi:AbrB/MazE/SpoVT family DNA-binding domain-containing protein [Candidatus Uhrbacteria bacterium]|nr:AbrB/MazE/SpoVT family DNA-binding domain-containing protein [Candidatus Uhrbacteria bacterium]